MRLSDRIFLFLFIGAAFCSAQELSIPIKVTSSSGESQLLFLGLDPKATDGIDTQLDETPVPPPPPKGGFDARINLPSPFQESTLKDFRFGTIKNFKALVKHEIQYQSSAGSAIEISWALPPGIYGTIQDKFNGVVINKNMVGNGSVTITNASINKLDIVFDFNFSSTGIESTSLNSILPTESNLYQNYPNPFNPETTISYKVQAASKVSLKVFDLLGREVTTLVDEYKQAGEYNCKLRIKNLPAGRQGGELPSGVYFYRLQAGNPLAGSGQGFVETKKMTVIK